MTAPILSIEQIPTNFGANGYWLSDSPDIIHIEEDLVKQYESYSTPYVQPDAVRLFFIILICHEFTHWGDALDYLGYNNDPRFEVGDHLEFDVLGHNNNPPKSLTSIKLKITQK